MRLCTIAVAVLLLPLVALAPTVAAAADLCQTYGICKPGTDPSCEVDARAVRVCDGVVYVCTARYFGGGGGGPLNNFVWDCDPVMIDRQCQVNGYAVRADTCAGGVQACEGRYYGGGGGTPLDNFVWECHDILA